MHSSPLPNVMENFTFAQLCNDVQIFSTLPSLIVNDSLLILSIKLPECLQNSSEPELAHVLPLKLRTAATIVCALVLTLGISGNILVPFVVCRTKELCNSTNLFLINLSIADLLVIIVCMPTVLIELHSKPEVWILGPEMCKAVPFVEQFVAHGSILTILAISFERYYAICKPLKAGYKCTQMRALIIILAVWMVAIIATLPMLTIAEQTRVPYIDGSEVPVCLTQANTSWQKVYFLASMAAFFWAPLCILVVVYSIITKRLVLDDRRDASLVHHSEQAQMRARRQVVFMLAAVIVCFFVCLLPFRVLTLWLIFASPDQLRDLGMEAYYNLLYFCRILLYINSAANPCLYAAVSSKFREAFVMVLCCKRRNRLLIRQSTFNTTSSSVVMSSLKNSLHRAVQAKNSTATEAINATVRNLGSPLLSSPSAKNFAETKYRDENCEEFVANSDANSFANNIITTNETRQSNESYV